MSFNLSEKIEEEGFKTWGMKDGVLDVDDVKEFIRRLKDVFKEQEKANGKGCGIFIDDIFADLDHLAGNKLISVEKEVEDERM